MKAGYYNGKGRMDRLRTGGMWCAKQTARGVAARMDGMLGAARPWAPVPVRAPLAFGTRAIPAICGGCGARFHGQKARSNHRCRVEPPAAVPTFCQGGCGVLFPSRNAAGQHAHLCPGGGPEGAD